MLEYNYVLYLHKSNIWFYISKDASVTVKLFSVVKRKYDIKNSDNYTKCFKKKLSTFINGIF